MVNETQFELFLNLINIEKETSDYEDRLKERKEEEEQELNI